MPVDVVGSVTLLKGKCEECAFETDVVAEGQSEHPQATLERHAEPHRARPNAPPRWGDDYYDVAWCLTCGWWSLYSPQNATEAHTFRNLTHVVLLKQSVLHQDKTSYTIYSKVGSVPIVLATLPFRPHEAAW